MEDHIVLFQPAPTDYQPAATEEPLAPPSFFKRLLARLKRAKVEPMAVDGTDAPPTPETLNGTQPAASDAVVASDPVATDWFKD